MLYCQKDTWTTIWRVIYQSIPSLTIPPGKPAGNLCERANSPPPGHKESAKPRPLGQKNHAKTPRPGQLFCKKSTKHETEIMKNSTEVLICLKHLKTQSF